MAEVYIMACFIVNLCVGGDGVIDLCNVHVEDGNVMEKKSDYEIYLDRYCTKHKVSREDAEKHNLVQEYKRYCEEKEAEEKPESKGGLMDGRWIV